MRGIEAATDLATAIRTGSPIRARDVIAALDDAIADLAHVRQTVTQALVRAHNDTDSAISSSSAGEHVAATKVVDRATAERAVANLDRTDSVAKRAQSLIEAIAGTRGLASLARSDAQALLPLRPEHAQQLTKAIEGGPRICANCQTNVWNTATDRLLAGRCRPCYDYRRAHDGVERPRELWT